MRVSNRFIEYSIYTVLCVFVFAVTTFIGGWLNYDYWFLLKLNRLEILWIISLNLFIDVIVISFAYMNIDVY